MENKTIASTIIKKTPLNCFDIISRATDLYADRSSFAYFYGAKGQVLTRKLMDSLVLAESAYFAKYTKDEMRNIYSYSIGRIGIDCSGLINLLTGRVNWSSGYWQESVNKTDPISGTWGNILYTTFGGTGRHIGIDIGQGRFLHAPSEMHSIEMGYIRDYPWEGSGQLAGVSYFLTGDK